MLSADDKLGMSLDDIIKRSRRGNNRNDNRRGRRFGNRQIKRPFRGRVSTAQIQARAYSKPSRVITTGQRVQQRIMRPPLAKTQLSLTTPGFRARQRRQQALVAMAKRLTRRKISQLAVSRKPRRLQAQPLIIQSALRKKRLAIVRTNPRRRVRPTTSGVISDRQFDELLDSSRSFRNSSEGERRFLSRQLADVAADRRRRPTQRQQYAVQSSNVVGSVRRLPPIRPIRRAIPANEEMNRRAPMRERTEQRGRSLFKRRRSDQMRVNFDDGRSVLRRSSRSTRRIQEARRYDRFYSDDEDNFEDSNYVTMGSLYADEIAPRRVPPSRRFPKLRRQVVLNAGSRRRYY